MHVGGVLACVLSWLLLCVYVCVSGNLCVSLGVLVTICAFDDVSVCLFISMCMCVYQ